VELEGLSQQDTFSGCFLQAAPFLELFPLLCDKGAFVTSIHLDAFPVAIGSLFPKIQIQSRINQI
jgi:hypothetical protein